MMLVNKAYKFRIYPNKKQTELINKTIGCARFVFNFFLGKQKDKNYWHVVEEMKQNGQLPTNDWKGKYFNKYETIKALPSLKRDRKSTRLNSSHVAISYAVFCLKKKNNYKLPKEYLSIYRLT